MCSYLSMVCQYIYISTHKTIQWCLDHSLGEKSGPSETDTSQKRESEYWLQKCAGVIYQILTACPLCPHYRCLNTRWDSHTSTKDKSTNTLTDLTAERSKCCFCCLFFDLITKIILNLLLFWNSCFKDH